MFKKISGLCASAVCLMGLCTTAFADGPVGRAIGGVVDAGEDIADGIFNAGEDIVDGVTGETGSAGGDENGDVPDLTTPDDSTTSGDTTTSDPDSATSGDSTTSGGNAIGDTSDGLISGVEESGATGGNPGTGDVTMGYAAFSAVLAAMGVTLSSIRRKQD